MDGINTNSKPRAVSFKRIVLALVLAAIVPSIIFQKLLMIMYVPSESMYPTMTGGDVLIGTRIASSYQRGDIVVFQADTIMIKRVVGLPGEEVCIAADGSVSIDGDPLYEPYVICRRKGQPQAFSVPEGCFLLLGDNRQNSYDSRYWDYPYIEEDSIIAVAKYKLFEGSLD